MRGRLVLGLVISLAAVFALQSLLVPGVIRRMIEDYVNSRLSHDSESVLSAIVFDDKGEPSLKPDGIDAIYHRPFSGHYFKIIIEGAPLRSRSLWDRDISIQGVGPGDSRVLHVAGPEGQTLIVIVSGYKKQGREITIAVAEDLSRIESDIARFQAAFALFSIVVLVSLITVQWLIVRAGFAPLARAREEAKRLERGEIERIETETPSEIQPLVEEINHLLGIMTQRLKRSRNALGALAHALKTPLTTLVRLADESEDVRSEERVSMLKKNTRVIQDLIERELARARLAGPARPGQAFQAEKDTADIIETLKSIYRDKNLEIEWSVAPNVSFNADREDMMELLGILLDNACKWARSRVRLKIENGSRAIFIVEDDGPGCPDEKIGDLTKRGARHDERASGHGLGLAIALDIVESYSGNIELGRSESMGGFMASATLPALSN